MSKGTARRTVRIDDQLWCAAAQKADSEGVTVSDILREALERYIAAE
jgi:antitoxin component of RelBE/YafQ-DinJ toxin-antitoxin module